MEFLLGVGNALEFYRCFHKLSIKEKHEQLKQRIIELFNMTVPKAPFDSTISPFGTVI